MPGSSRTTAGPARLRGRGFLKSIRRELAILGVAVAALMVVLPMASRANREYESAQRFLDSLAAATGDVRSAGPSAVDLEARGLSGGSTALDEETRATALVGSHAGRCFLVHWRTPEVSGPRAGVLDPSLACEASAALLATLPSPPLVEAFPGTVPPLDAGQLRTGSGAAFPVERTPGWFVPTALTLLAAVMWQLAGITIKWLQRRPRLGLVRHGRSSPPQTA
jgi:hypothetical protein